MLPDIHRATQKFYIFLIVYLTGCTPGYLGIGTLNSLINGKKSEQKYFDTGVIMIDSDYLMEKGVS